MQLTAAMRSGTDRLKNFLREVRVEMTKVTWPTWEELKGHTIVVIVAVLLIAAFIGVVDWVLNTTVKLLVTRLS